MNGIVGADGKEYQRVPVVEFGDIKLPVREIDPQVLIDRGATEALGLLTQMNDQNAMLWAGMMMLAKDIYQRDPKTKDGSAPHRFFGDFAEKTGLHIQGVGGERIDVSAYLNKIK